MNQVEGLLSHFLSAAPEELAQLELPVSRPRPDPIEGAPVEAFRRFFDDGSTVAGIWECTPGRFPAEKRGKNSFMYFLAGRGTVTDDDGAVHQIRPQSVLIAPDGFSGEWHILETVRKFYVITRTPSS